MKAVKYKTQTVNDRNTGFRKVNSKGFKHITDVLEAFRSYKGNKYEKLKDLPKDVQNKLKQIKKVVGNKVEVYVVGSIPNGRYVDKDTPKDIQLIYYSFKKKKYSDIDVAFKGSFDVSLLPALDNVEYKLNLNIDNYKEKKIKV